MERRHFLSVLSAAPAFLSTSSVNAREIPNKSLTSAGFITSIQCWSFREFSLLEAIEMAGQAGARGIEVFPGQEIGGPLKDQKVDPHNADEQVPVILKHCEEHGVIPVNYGVTGVPNDEVKARAIFEFAKQLGLYGITTESLGSLDTLEKLAVEYDLKVCFHNHPKPTKLWNPNTVWEAIQDRDDRIGYCADLGHWATSGLVPLEVIQKIAPRVRSFHMKDRGEIGSHTHDRPFGEGIIQLAEILDTVRKEGFAGNVSIEYEHHWETSLPEIAQCVGFLRGYSELRA